MHVMSISKIMQDKTREHAAKEKAIDGACWDTSFVTFWLYKKNH